MNEQGNGSLTTNGNSENVSNPSETLAPVHSNNAPALLNSISAQVNLLNKDDYDKAKVLLGSLIRSDKCPIKTVEDGMALLLRAQDLKLPFSACLEHIHVINGKTGVDIHIIKTLLLRAGVTWECLDDYAPLYEFTDGFNVYNEAELPSYARKCINKEEAEKVTSDTTNELVGVYPVKFYKGSDGNNYKDYQLNANRFGIATNPAEVAKVVESGKIAVWRVPAIPYDRISRYRLKRVKNGIEMTSVGSFSLNEALVAGMFEKDTYKKYPKTLIGHRAFTYAARDIASDVIMGLMETTELKIVSKLDINASDITDIDEAEIVELN